MEIDCIPLVTPNFKPPVDQAELIIEWLPKVTNITWDSKIRAHHPSFHAFEQCLETGWAEELIARLQTNNFAWEMGRPRIHMPHSRLDGVTFGTAAWIRELLPKIYEQGTYKFEGLRAKEVKDDIAAVISSDTAESISVRTSHRPPAPVQASPALVQAPAEQKRKTQLRCIVEAGSD